MSQDKNFWAQDRTTLHAKDSWFSKLPPLQRITYLLLLVFIVCWCFYLGMNLAYAATPPYEGEILYGYTPNEQLENNQPAKNLSGQETLLLVGVDRRPEENSARTDTIMLVFIDWDTAGIKLLSLPRDSYVQLPGTNTKTKLNAAYYSGGISLLQNTIEYTFGISTRHYVEIDFAGFVKVIDLLDGVEIDVPRDMQNLDEGIDLQQGRQTLYGADALAFVRFREKVLADIGRIERQQLFMQALGNKLATTSLLPKAPQLIPIVLENCVTDFSLSQIMRLAEPLTKLDLSSIQTYSLPGEGLYIRGANYFVLDAVGCAAKLEEITGRPVEGLHIIDDGGQGTEYPYKPQQQITEEEDKAEVQVEEEIEEEVIVEEPETVVEEELAVEE